MVEEWECTAAWAMVGAWECTVGSKTCTDNLAKQQSSNNNLTLEESFNQL